MTDKQQADEQLAAAIRAHAVAYNLGGDGDMLDEYAVVAQWQTVDANERSNRYSTHFTRATIPYHVAVGLFTTAIGLTIDDTDND